MVTAHFVEALVAEYFHMQFTALSIICPKAYLLPQSANPTNPPFVPPAPPHSFYPSGRIFIDFPSALKIHKEWSTFLSAADKAGLTHTLTDPSAALTVFLPSHKAFSSKHRPVDGSAKALSSLLRYHAVPGANELPGGFKQLVGQNTLLSGHHITMKMET